MRNGRSAAAIAGVLLAATAHAQTKLDLRMQARNVDFSGATLTKPFRSGTSLPALCGIGETFFKSDAPAGANLYLCAPANVWTLQSSFRSMVSAATPASGDVLRWNAASNQWEPSASGGGVTSVFGRSGAVTAQTGDYSFAQISGSLSTSQIGSGILGIARGGTGASSLKTNAILTGAGTSPLQASGCSIDAAGALVCPGGITAGFNSGTPGESVLYDAGGVNYYSWLAPSSIGSPVRFQFPAAPPVEGQVMAFGAPAGGVSLVSFVSPLTAAGADVFQNKTLDDTNRLSGHLTWTQVATPSAAPSGSLRVFAKTGAGLCWVNSSGAETCAGAGAVSSVFGRTGAVAAQAGDYTAAQVANAADVTAANIYSSGAKQTFQASATTAGVRIACAPLPSTPSTGDLACDSADGNKLKQWNGSAWVVPASTNPVLQGAIAAIPGSCPVGQLYFATDAPAGQNLYYCTAANTWTQQAIGGGGGLPSAVWIVNPLTTIAASATVYSPLGVWNAGSEMYRYHAIGRAGTIAGIALTNSGNQGAGTMVVKVRKNASTDLCVLTVPSGGNGVFSATGCSGAFGATDLLSISVTNNAPATSPTINSIAVTYQ